MRWSRGDIGLGSRLAHRRVSLFFWHDDGLHVATTALVSTPWRLPRADLRQFGGEVFFKSLDGQLVLRVVARPTPQILAKPSAFGLGARSVVSSSEMANVSKSHRASVLAPPAHDAVDRSSRPGRPQQPPTSARTVIGVELRGISPGDCPIDSARPVRGTLKRSTQVATTGSADRRRPCPRRIQSCCHHRRPQANASMTTALRSRPWSLTSRGAAVRRCQRSFRKSIGAAMANLISSPH